MQKIPLAIAAVAIFTALAYVGGQDRAEAQRQQTRYCENVATWLAQKARGVEPLNRTGHPDYQGTAATTCPGLHPAD